MTIYFNNSNNKKNQQTYLNPGLAELIVATPTSNFQPIRLFDSDCCYELTFLMTNSADPDQLTSSEAN